MKLFVFIFCLLCGFLFGNAQTETPPLLVKKCADFQLTGNGDNSEWSKTEWVLLSQLDSSDNNYESKFKILYSAGGIYLLFSGADNKITTRYDKDFDNLFNGDVFEAFFHPNPKLPLYFEYEINALNKELVLLIPNFNGSFFGWQPWHYEGKRKIKKLVNVQGGKSEKGAAIQSWTAEVFFPNEVLSSLENVPPASGSVWNANFCRLDYDSGKMVKWSWSPVEASFHEYKKFRSIKFE